MFLIETSILKELKKHQSETRIRTPKVTCVRGLCLHLEPSDLPAQSQVYLVKGREINKNTIGRVLTRAHAQLAEKTRGKRRGLPSPKWVWADVECLAL